MTGRNKKDTLRDIFNAAIDAASPYTAVHGNLRITRSGKRLLLKTKSSSIDLNRFKRIFVAGAGKAVCPMARAAEELLGNRITDGLVVTKYGHSEPLKRIRVKEAGHPLPDRSGVEAASEMLRMASGAGEDGLFLFLLTGGASALLPAPAFGLSLRDKQKASALLINSGAAIEEINTVRKHLSLIKGGRLALAASPAEVLTLIVSDVVENDLSSIGSGPTAPDLSTYGDALRIVGSYHLAGKMPKRVLDVLRLGARGGLPETPKPQEPLFRRVSNVIVADNLSALQAAAKKAAALGFKPIVLSSTITGNTRESATFFAAVLKEVKRSESPVKRPACLLMGGETTLKVSGKGAGGRNQEFALALACALKGEESINVLSAGTDGTDGTTEAAGAFAMPDTLSRAKAMKIDPLKYLARNDSYNFFRKTDGLFITGPTGTNVMDIVIGIVER